MKKIVTACFAAMTLAACGGGGGGSPGQSTTPPPATTPVAINVETAMLNFINQGKTTRAIPAVSPNTGAATLILRSEDSVPFYANGMLRPATTTRVIQFQEENTGGVLVFQDLWRVNLDAQMRPVGMALGRSFSDYKACMLVTGTDTLPTSSSGSGQLFSGVWSYGYEEGYRGGVYAHYCDMSDNVLSQLTWSVLPGTPSPYFCVAMTVPSNTGKTRICQQSTPAGAISSRTWITVFYPDGTVNREYKN